eukprot:1152565-Pelagomonas_calceolata.AAC.12
MRLGSDASKRTLHLVDLRTSATKTSRFSNISNCALHCNPHLLDPQTPARPRPAAETSNASGGFAAPPQPPRR